MNYYLVHHLSGFRSLFPSKDKAWDRFLDLYRSGSYVEAEKAFPAIWQWGADSYNEIAGDMPFGQRVLSARAFEIYKDALSIDRYFKLTIDGLDYYWCKMSICISIGDLDACNSDVVSVKPNYATLFSERFVKLWKENNFTGCEFIPFNGNPDEFYRFRKVATGNIENIFAKHAAFVTQHPDALDHDFDDALWSFLCAQKITLEEMPPPVMHYAATREFEWTFATGGISQVVLSLEEDKDGFIHHFSRILQGYEAMSCEDAAAMTREAIRMILASNGDDLVEAINSCFANEKLLYSDKKRIAYAFEHKDQFLGIQPTVKGAS